jgi:hypothetical protein
MRSASGNGIWQVSLYQALSNGNGPCKIGMPQAAL